MTIAGKTAIWIGIGASAGGLDALRTLVASLPLHANTVYIVAQHMSPHHNSTLAALLARETDLPVVEIEDNMPTEIDTIYVPPPNCDVVIKNGRLRLRAPATEIATPKPSVNRLFRSMAENLASRAIAVVLSGTGSDGAFGVQAIRAAGGYTIAQSRETAAYFGMPDAAIQTGCVDAILAPEDIGPRFPTLGKVPKAHAAASDSDDVLNERYAQLLTLIRDRTDVDFRDYKAATLRRRIERRIATLNLPGFEEYYDYAEANPEEVLAVFRDMMISVTSFFRDGDEFTALERQLKDVLDKAGDRGLRVWVPGCASGEEAYSVAIVLAELRGGLTSLDAKQLQIFATDIDTDALARARRGYYPDAVMETVPEALRDKYFTRQAGGYVIKGALRDCIVFTQHNLCQDPPFSNIDLVTCRNVMIYFTHELQERVLNRLHYALKPNGLLMLGKPEWVNGGEDLFLQASSDGKIFKRRVNLPQRQGRVAPGLPSPRSLQTEALQQERRNVAEAQGMFDALVRAIGPNCLLVNASHQIKRIYGTFDRYVSLTEGHVQGVTVDVLHADLRQEVRTLISLAIRNKEVRTGTERSVRCPDPVRVQVSVYPLSSSENADHLAIVALKEIEDVETALDASERRDNPDLSQMERELMSTRQSLQQTVEEFETTNEELQALNEELQSGNEELQSINEELETANEELQSTNEELITVNEELQINSHELSIINQELDSILSNIAAPVLVVDAGLHIVRCSDSAREMFQIDPAAGRPHLSQCTRREDAPELMELVSDVLRFGTRAERTYQSRSGSGRVVASPYFSSTGELIGATAIISDRGSAVNNHDVQALIDGIPAMVWQKDRDDRVLWMNAEASRAIGKPLEDVIGKPMADFAPSLSQQAGSLDAEVVATMTPKTGRHEKATMPDGTTLWLDTSRIPFRLSDGRTGIYVIAQDISAQYQPHIDRRQAESLIEAIVDAAPVAIEYVDAAGQLQFQNLHARQLDGLKTVGEDWRAGPDHGVLIDPDTEAPMDLARHPVLRSLRGESVMGDMVIRLDRDGSQNPQWTHAVTVIGQDDNIAGAIGVAVSLNGHHVLDASARDGEKAPLHVIDWSIQSGNVVLSPRLRSLLGLPDDAPLASIDDMRSLIETADLERFDTAIEAHLDHRVPFHCAFRVVRDGQDGLTWLEARGQAVWDDAGRPAHFIMTLTDITEAWIEQRSIGRRTALADMAEETGELASWTLDLMDMHVRLSPAAARTMLLGPRSSLPLDELLNTIDRDDRAIVRHGLRSATEEGIPFSATVRLLKDASPSKRVLISGHPEKDPSGAVTGLVGLTRVISVPQLMAVGE